MIAVRRSLVLAWAERYIVTLVSLATVVVVARLLTPAEIGIAVLGTTLLSFAEALRDLGCSGYLIQRRELTQDRIQTAFTIMLLTTIVLAIFIALLIGPLAAFYGTRDLSGYIGLHIISFLIGPFCSPIFALLRRDLAIGQLAVVNVATASTNSIMTVLLAVCGVGLMSFAWASILSAILGLVLGLWLRPDRSIFKLSLAHWREVIGFGGYESATEVLNRLWESSIYLLIGRFAGAGAVGLFQRAMTISTLPSRMLLAGVSTIALPLLSATARRSGDMKRSFLLAVSLVTGLLWPALALVVLLAQPLVAILLGHQWLECVPLVQILSVALMVPFLGDLTYPTLASLGAVRRALTLNGLFVPAAIAILAMAAPFGAMISALAMIPIMAVKLALSIYFLRGELAFTGRELGAAIVRSAALVPITVAPVLVIIAINGGRFDLGFLSVVAAGVLAVACWLAGVNLVRHPFQDEISRLQQVVAERWPYVWGWLGPYSVPRKPLS